MTLEPDLVPGTVPLGGGTNAHFGTSSSRSELSWHHITWLLLEAAIVISHPNTMDVVVSKGFGIFLPSPVSSSRGPLLLYNPVLQGP